MNQHLNIHIWYILHTILYTLLKIVELEMIRKNTEYPFCKWTLNIFKRWPIPLYLMWIEQTVIFWIRIGGGGVVGGPSPSSTFQLMSKLCRSFSIFDNYLLALLDSKPDQQHTFLFSGWEKGGPAGHGRRGKVLQLK